MSPLLQRVLLKPSSIVLEKNKAVSELESYLKSDSFKLHTMTAQERTRILDKSDATGREVKWKAKNRASEKEKSIKKRSSLGIFSDEIESDDVEEEKFARNNREQALLGHWGDPGSQVTNMRTSTIHDSLQRRREMQNTCPTKAIASSGPLVMKPYFSPNPSSPMIVDSAASTHFPTHEDSNSAFSDNTTASGNIEEIPSAILYANAGYQHSTTAPNSSERKSRGSPASIYPQTTINSYYDMSTVMTTTTATSASTPGSDAAVGHTWLQPGALKKEHTGFDTRAAKQDMQQSSAELGINNLVDRLPAIDGLGSAGVVQGETNKEVHFAEAASVQLATPKATTSMGAPLRVKNSAAESAMEWKRHVRSSIKKFTMQKTRYLR